MLVGDPAYRSPSPIAQEFKSIAFRCFTEPWGPAPPASEIGGDWDTRYLPNKPCPYGLRVNNFFPTCWDGANVDSTCLQCARWLSQLRQLYQQLLEKITSILPSSY